MHWLVLGVLLSLGASVAQGQRAPSDTALRVAVIGQTDSIGLALAERVRARLADAARGGHAIIVTTHDVNVTVNMAYRFPSDPMGLRDIREFGKLVAADIVLALVPDSSRVGNVQAFVLHSRLNKARRLGSWPAAGVEQSSAAILRAFQGDSLYRRIVAQ